MRQVLYSFQPRIVLNRFVDPTTYSYMTNFIEKYYKPIIPKLSIAGAMPNDPTSIKYISALKYLNITNFADARLKPIAKYLAHKINSLNQQITPKTGFDNLYVDDLFSIRQSALQQNISKQLDIHSRRN